jgi:hypothetical protein
LRESKRRIFELEEEAIFAELGHAFQGWKLAQKSRQEVQHNSRPYSTDLRVVQPFVGTEIEEEEQH